MGLHRGMLELQDSPVEHGPRRYDPTTSLRRENMAPRQVTISGIRCAHVRPHGYHTMGERHLGRHQRRTTKRGGCLRRRCHVMCHIHNTTPPTEVAASGADATEGTTRPCRTRCTNTFLSTSVHTLLGLEACCFAFSDYEHRLITGHCTGV